MEYLLCLLLWFCFPSVMSEKRGTALLSQGYFVFDKSGCPEHFRMILPGEVGHVNIVNITGYGWINNSIKSNKGLKCLLGNISDNTITDTCWNSCRESHYTICTNVTTVLYLSTPRNEGQDQTTQSVMIRSTTEQNEESNSQTTQNPMLELTTLQNKVSNGQTTQNPLLESTTGQNKVLNGQTTHTSLIKGTTGQRKDWNGKTTQNSMIKSTTEKNKDLSSQIDKLAIYIGIGVLVLLVLIVVIVIIAKKRKPNHKIPEITQCEISKHNDRPQLAAIYSDVQDAIKTDEKGSEETGYQIVQSNNYHTMDALRFENNIYDHTNFTCRNVFPKTDISDYDSLQTVNLV